MPNSGLPQFSGTTINNITNTSSVISGHANNVGYRFFGSNLSLTPDISTVNVRSANDFINNFIKLAGSVSSTTDPVMSHAYIFGSDDDVSEAQVNILLTRFDFFSINSNIINVVGINNGSGTNIGPGWAASYNSITIGRTDGSHARGETPTGYESPGRQKPDIVANETATSWTTGSISSAAALLRQKALEHSNSDAVHPDTIKAALLSGATKSEFPNWTQTSTKPLDPIYGAGEVNIFRSYRIIENDESSTGNVNHRGWARNTTKAETSGFFGSAAITHTYTFSTPADQIYPSLSTTLIWQRPVTSLGNTYSYGNLANLKLELLNASDTVIQTSDSSIDNVEHIWNPTLTPNTTYKLRVSSASTTTTNFSLAWIVSGENQINATITKNPTTNDLNLAELLIGTQYKLQRSTNLTTWTTIETFTAATATETHTDTTPPSNEEVFYRLKFFHP